MLVNSDFSEVVKKEVKILSLKKRSGYVSKIGQKIFKNSLKNKQYYSDLHNKGGEAFDVKA